MYTISLSKGTYARLINTYLLLENQINTEWEYMDYRGVSGVFSVASQLCGLHIYVRRQGIDLTIIDIQPRRDGKNHLKLLNYSQVCWVQNPSPWQLQM